MKVSDILRVKGGTLYVVKPDDSLAQAMATVSNQTSRDIAQIGLSSQSRLGGFVGNRL